jgi:hypothetical protein
MLVQLRTIQGDDSMVHISISDLILDETSSPRDCLDLKIRESSMILGGQAMRPVSNSDLPSPDDVGQPIPPQPIPPVNGIAGEIPIPLIKPPIRPPMPAIFPGESKP